VNHVEIAFYKIQSNMILSIICLLEKLMLVSKQIHIKHILAHMSEGVEVVVGQLELLEGHQLPHPVRAGGRRVRVHIQSPRHRRLGFPRHRPADTRATDGFLILFEILLI